MYSDNNENHKQSQKYIGQITKNMNQFLTRILMDLKKKNLGLNLGLSFFPCGFRGDI